MPPVKKQRKKKTPPPDSKRCTYIMNNGDRCTMPRVRGTNWCCRHGEDDTQTQRKRAFSQQQKWRKIKDKQYEAQTKLGLYSLADIPRIVAFWIEEAENDSELSRPGLHSIRNMYLKTATTALAQIGESGKRIILSWEDGGKFKQPDGPRPTPPISDD